MRRAIGAMVLGWAVFAAAGSARADGKFFVAEKVPPDLPYQRAILVFHGGTETLIVQSKYDLSQTADVNSIGWVVPVPAVPELTGMDAIEAWYTFMSVSRLTQPNITRARDVLSLLILVSFLASSTWLLTCVARCLAFEACWLERGARREHVRWASLATAVTLFLALDAYVFGVRVTAGSQEEDVEVLKVQPVGIYDVAVIRGDSAEPVVEWLNIAGFHFSDSDKAVFADYVARGWCFVAAKVRAGVEARSVEGLVDPLVLTFPTDKPIYPLALTATAGAKTEILLYAVSDAKLTCRRRLRLRCATPVKKEAVSGLFSVKVAPSDGSESPRYEPTMDIPNETLMLCKFKGTMTAAQMARDLEFEPAADNEPFTERRIVW